MEKLVNLKLSNESEELIKKLYSDKENENFKIAILGEFSVGKSAIINKLIDNNLLPTHSIETTAIPTVIKYSSEHEKAFVKKLDGEIFEIEIDQLKDLKANNETIYDIENVEIYLNTPEWLDKIEIVDTPGRNTKFEQHKIASKKAFVESDLGIYVMNWKGLSRDDLLYIQEILQYQKKLLFVINKMDLINESEGLSRNQIIEDMKKNLKQQLGLEFPVIGTSIEEENSINILRDEYILTNKEKVGILKQERFEYVVNQLLNNHIQDLKIEIDKLHFLSNADDKNLEYERNRLQNQIEEEKVAIEHFNTSIFKQLKDEERELLERYSRTFDRESNKLKKIIKESPNLNIEEFKLLIANSLMKVQEELKNFSINQLNITLDDTVNYQPKPFDNSEIIRDINVQEYDFAFLQNKYNNQKEQLLNKYNDLNKKLKLRSKDLNNNDEDIQELQEELKNLETEIEEKYVPQYIQEIPDDINRNEKAMNVIGIIGDIGMSVAIGALTGGASVAAQLSAEASKQVTKKAALKNIIKQTAKATAKEGAKSLKNKVEKEYALRSNQLDEENTNHQGSNKVIDALDFVTSPIQSITRNIGKNMDAQYLQSLNEKEDLQYKREFFANRQRKLEKFNKTERELRQIKETHINNDQIKEKVERKLIENQEKLRKEQLKIEEDYEKELKQKVIQHTHNQLNAQLDIIIENVYNNMVQWLNIEIEELLKIVKDTIPSIKLEKLNKLEKELADANDYNSNNIQENNEQIKELELAIDKCEELIGEING